jgi:hypothetical protein
MINLSLEKLGNLAVIWNSSHFESKRAFQKLLFPEGIYYNSEKHSYRTQKINAFVELVNSFSNFYKEKKEGEFQHFVENSPLVAREGVEPSTSGL